MSIFSKTLMFLGAFWLTATHLRVVGHQPASPLLLVVWPHSSTGQGDPRGQACSSRLAD